MYKWWKPKFLYRRYVEGILFQTKIRDYDFGYGISFHRAPFMDTLDIFYEIKVFYGHNWFSIFWSHNNEPQSREVMQFPFNKYGFREVPEWFHKKWEK